MPKTQATAADEPGEPPRAQPDGSPAPPASALAEERLLRLEHMFLPFADDALMGELRRLAVKCAREGLIRG